MWKMKEMKEKMKNNNEKNEEEEKKKKMTFKRIIYLKQIYLN